MDFDHPPVEPLKTLHQWLDDARQTDLPNPNAMSLATVGADGTLSIRTVLLKGLDEDGAVFYTNRTSRKGRALEASPQAALLFHWDMLTRQVKIEGRVSRADDARSDAYFATRPRMSQIGAWASAQSEPCASRAELDAAVETYEKQFEGRDVPRPPHWGGYVVSLDRVEFWQGHPFRLHDRVEYIAEGSGGWRVQRLYP